MTKKLPKEKEAMENKQIYESYPFLMVFIVTVLALSIYFAGAYILFTLHWIGWMESGETNATMLKYRDSVQLR